MHRIRTRPVGTRPGLTIIEVLFAIGIALIGLLGIASLLPLAAHSAGQSARLSEGQALANLWYDELIVKGINDSSNWRYFQDFKTGSLNPGFLTYDQLPTQKSAYWSATRVIAKQAICIDPYFLTSRDVATPVSSGAFNEPSSGPPPAEHRWYRPSMFPYYLDTFNPVVDPSYPFGSQQSYALADAQPRMVRVTLGGGLGNVSAKYVEQLFASGDDLAYDVEKGDASVSPTRTLVAGGASFPIAKMAAKGEYSWIATVSPTDTLTSTGAVDNAILSLVVIFRRDLAFFDPSDSATVPPVRTPGQPETESKPKGERLFTVVPQLDGAGSPVSFKGGHGGRVTLVASDGVESQINVGDWVMLGKNRDAAGTQSVFRWFRIIATDSEAEYGDYGSVVTGGTAPDPVWARSVVLDGPDWQFDTSKPVTMPTTATYIPGAVAVHERIIGF